MVSTRNSKRSTPFEQLIFRTLNTAKSGGNLAVAIKAFTDETQRKEPFDFLLLHAAAAVSLKEFETCMRLYATSGGGVN